MCGSRGCDDKGCVYVSVECSRPRAGPRDQIEWPLLLLVFSLALEGSAHPGHSALSASWGTGHPHWGL